MQTKRTTAARRLPRLAILMLLLAGLIGPAASVSARSTSTSNISIVTTENGRSVTDACYVLVDFSIEGCDQNGDGKVTFRDVPLGVYTVHQTADLGPGRSISDFKITVTGAASSDGWERFSASVATSRSSSTSGASGSTVPVDIALITRDPQDGHLLRDACYVLVGYSNEGCDENGDGQVTFAAIPPGAYTVHQTRTPAGYPTINNYEIKVQPFRGSSKDYAIPLGFIVKQAAKQNAPKTRNVSVVFVDSRKYSKVVSSICMQFVGASDLGCDEDLIDGQIDFLDVPAGTYEIKYTNLPAGWQILGPDMVAPTVTIDAGSDAPTDQIIYIGVYVPDSPSASSGDGGVAASADSTASDSVGDNGFTLMLDGVSVSGDPDVAPKGTSVQAKLVTEALPDELKGFASTTGAGVEITLGDGIQPASPLRITFAPDIASGSSATSDPTGDLLPVVFASKEDGSGVELADAQIMPDGSIVVIADHLSWFQKAYVSISGFTSWLGKQVEVFFQVSSDKPNCVDQSGDDAAWQISPIPDQLIWPCVEQTGDDVKVTLTNNSPEVWLVGSTQATPGYPSVLSPVDMVFAAIVLQGIDKATTSPLIPPDGGATFNASGADDQIVLNATLNAPLTVIKAAVTALLIFADGRVLDDLGKADCLIHMVSTAIDTAAIPDDEAFTDVKAGSFASTIAGCLSTTLGLLGESLAGDLFSAVADAPGALAANLEGAYLTATGKDSFPITLTKKESSPDDQQTSSSPASGWPTDRDDGPGRLYVWLGASVAFGGPGYPDWVACDDAAAYCLLGYDDGSAPVLVEMSGLSVVGELDYSADPRQELLALGLSDDIVTQILGG